jgi:ribosome-associated heat shock protein Hsp15
MSSPMRIRSGSDAAFSRCAAVVVFGRFGLVVDLVAVGTVQLWHTIQLNYNDKCHLNTFPSARKCARTVGAMTDGTRVDQWLWAIRLYKTRSAANEACRGGHVKINGASAKPAAAVEVGDRVIATIHGRLRDVEVVELITKRVGAPIAAQCYVDHSPPPSDEDRPLRRLFPRDAGSGRPTKRDRRATDRLRGR